MCSMAAHQERCVSYGMIMVMVTCQHMVQYEGANPLPHRLAEEALLRAAFSAFLLAAQQLLSNMGALQGKQNSVFSEWIYPRIRRGGRVDERLRIL
jgi:hypothetical protein